MIKHLFKLMWYKRRKHFLLMSEIFVSFLVLFGVFSLVVYYLTNYRKPLGFDYENVWVINYGAPEGQRDTTGSFQEAAGQILKEFPEIEAFSFCMPNVPFAMSSSNTNIDYESKSTFANFYSVREPHAAALGLKILEGRWFEKEDLVAAHRAIIINESLKEELFGNEQAVGKLTGTEQNQQRIIGVVQDFKDKGTFQPTEPGFFIYANDTDYKYFNTLLIKTQPGAGADLEARVWKRLTAANPVMTIEIEKMSDKKKTIDKFTWIPMLILGIVCGFLIFNVALGLFGVLWYNISRRREEIGIRRAIGASGNRVTRQIIGEALVIASFALGLGVFLAAQFPLLHVFDLAAGIYIQAMVLAVIFIYLVVWLCALYPGKQAAAIQPAMALHAE